MVTGSGLAPHILDLVTDAVIVTDMHTRIHCWNRAAASLYGWPAVGVMGKCVQEVLALRSYPDRTVIAPLPTLLHPAGHWRSRVIAAHQRGHDLVLDAAVQLLQDERGAPCGIAVIQRDITHEERLRTLLETSTDVIGVLDHAGRIAYLSPAIEAILGRPPEAFVGMPAAELVHAEDVPQLHQALQALQAPGAARTVQFRARHRDGTWHQYEALSKNLADHPAVGGIVMNFRDITAREQARAALQVSEARFQAVFESAAIGIALANMTGHLITCNAAFARLLGYSADELHRMAFTTYTHPADVAAERVLYHQLVTGQRDHYHMEKRYLHKDQRVIWGRLNVSLVRDPAGAAQVVMGVVEDITEQKLAQERLQHQALHDALTGLPNRAWFLARLDQVLAHVKRRPTDRFAVLFLDLDRFKTVNDSLGHLVGDRVLVELARRLAATLRPQDTLARLGGDEFVILLADLVHGRDAMQVAQRIHDTLAIPFTVHGHELVMRTSIGIALSTPAYARPEELLRDADLAMYRAKAAGRNQWAVFDAAMHAHALHQFQVEAELRRAIEREEFVLHYQPIVSLTTGRLRGVEALVRWQHPEHGWLLPDHFISIAEDTGLIVPLGEWVLRTACTQLTTWHAAGFPALTVAVNISARQFRDPALCTMLANVLTATGLEARYLELELTEHSVMEQVETTSRLLEELHTLGVHLALDDFGTGYSSLSYLQRWPLTTIKLDRAFVAGSTTNANDAAITTAIITLAHTLNLAVIAEGVETAAQRDFLRGQHADAMQGYLCSPALPAAELFQRLQHRWGGAGTGAE